MIGYQVANQMRATSSGQHHQSANEQPEELSGHHLVKHSNNNNNHNNNHNNNINHNNDDDEDEEDDDIGSALSPHSQHSVIITNSSFQARGSELKLSAVKREADKGEPALELHAKYLDHYALASADKFAAHQSSMASLLQSNCGSDPHSPGYHSAAPSPCSTVDSPVSSTSSLAGSSGVGSTGNASSAGSMVMAVGPLTSNGSPCSTTSASPFHLLDYLPATNNDGLALSWCHEANNRVQLSEALQSTKMIISGDISLAEMSRYPVPIMARPPLGVSDLTLENWLQEVTRAQPQRGIKLTFTSTRTVEPAFRVLARHADLLRGPLILSADILSRSTPAGAPTGASKASGKQSASANSSNSSQQQQPVDAWTFLMMCRTRFPKCTVSIGWCSLGGAQPMDEAPSDGQLMASPSSCLFHQTGKSLEQPHFENLELAMDQLSGSRDLAIAGQHQTSTRNRGLSIHSNMSNLNGLNGLNPFQMIGFHHGHQHSGKHPNHRNHHHHHLASSAGSLSSSSGNSSGSPSPTSPSSQLALGSPYQTVAANLSLAAVSQHNATSNHHQMDPSEQLFFSAACSRHAQQAGGAGPESPAASAAAAAAAAAMTAALVAASTFHQQHQQHQQQLPLNLNINEADRQLTSSTGLAYQRHAHKQPFQAQDSLASRLFGISGPANCAGHAHKRAALSFNNMPVSSHRSCVSPSASQSRNSAAQQQQQQQARTSSGGNLLLKAAQQGAPQQPRVAPPSGGYTREMIDKMAALVKEYNLTQPVTFPVEARLLLRNNQSSLAELQRLLYQVGAHSSLTLVANADDLISAEELMLIRRSFAASQLLFDLPEQLGQTLRRLELEHQQHQHH